VGFFDKVKEQAEKAKEQAKDLRGKVEEKVDDVQHKRKADDLLDDLGRFLYAERTARPIAGADAEIDRIVNELKVLEQGGVPILPN
jgi:cell division septum initiation protein DivIVA